MDDVESLLCRIGGRRVIEGVEDIVRWIGSKNGLFSIKSLYKALEQKTPSSFPFGRLMFSQKLASLRGRRRGQDFNL